MTSNQPLLFPELCAEEPHVSPPTGDELRDDGIRRAAEHADQCLPNWTDQALQFVRDYPEKVFRTEQVRVWAHESGLQVPPHARAWGSVIVAAKKQGLIRFLRHENVSNPKAHSTPASVWEKTLAITGPRP